MLDDALLRAQNIVLLVYEIEEVFVSSLLCHTIRMVNRCAVWVLAPIIVWNSLPMVVRQYVWFSDSLAAFKLELTTKLLNSFF